MIADEEGLRERQLAECGIGQRQPQHEQRAGQHEQQPGRETALHAVQPPADIGRELHRLGAGEKHAEIQCRQIARLVDPALLVDDDAMHERDLAGRAAKREKPDLGPHLQRFSECRMARRSGKASSVMLAPLQRFQRANSLGIDDACPERQPCGYSAALGPAF